MLEEQQDQAYIRHVQHIIGQKQEKNLEDMWLTLQKKLEGKLFYTVIDHLFFYTIHGITKEARELYRNNPQWKPLLDWRRDAKASEERREDKEKIGGFNWAVQEQRILYGAARELGVDLVFGREIDEISDDGVVMIFQR